MPLPTIGTRREAIRNLALAEREKLIRQQILVGDSRRWRPRWFDGRFLAASDLQAEQNYFLIRQADLGRAGGSGVVEGLTVSEFVDPETGLEKLKIEAGSGVTDTGELVVLDEPLVVVPADVPQMQRLDAAFELQVIPNESGRNRTGLYVLALRPVEWTANPIAAYPTSLTGTRTAEDGTIVEGVAVSLIPYPDGNDSEDWNRRRARVARDIFVEGRDHGTNSGVLPLAMIALRGNIIEWVDVFMVRRETGAERPAGMDFGFGARALREAHLLQYQAHLADALNATSDEPFAAATQFDALPPIGQFPAGALNANDLTQRFFPAGIDVDLAFVPEDELPALIEESLLSPPLDLTAGVDGLQGTGVIVLVPLTRAKFIESRNTLPDWDATLPALRPVFNELRVNATPRALLLGRMFRFPTLLAPAPEEQAWRKFLREALNNQLLWYVRRRHLPIPSNVAGTPVNATSATISDRGRLVKILRTDVTLADSFSRVRAVGTPESAALATRLAAPAVLDNPGLLRDLMARAAGTEAAPAAPDAVVEVLKTAADPALGNGLVEIKKADPALVEALNTGAASGVGVIADVDKLAREIPAAKFTEFTAALKTATATPATLPAQIAQLRKRFIRP